MQLLYIYIYIGASREVAYQLDTGDHTERVATWVIQYNY